MNFADGCSWSETAVEELNPVAAGDDVEHTYLEKEKSCFENIKVKHLLAQLSPAPT